MFDIYCDESCHLENDESDIMVLGAITCPDEYKKKIYSDIRDIKRKYGLSSWFEIKWTKVSVQKQEFYFDLIEYFFEQKCLSFRGIVALNKNELDHRRYNNGDYNEWYYKMYFRLLDPLIGDTDEYRIFIDIKDTKGGPKVKKLHDVLCNNRYDFKHEVIKDIKQVNSNESEILQLTDLFIGALSYYNRGKYLESGASCGKVSLLNKLIEDHKIDLSKKTSRYEHKFNVFIWEPRRS